MKIQIELEEQGGRRVLTMVEMGRVPLRGEFIQLGEADYVVIAVLHTPYLRGYDALVFVKKAE